MGHSMGIGNIEIWWNMLDQAVQGEYLGIAQCLANVLIWRFWTLSSICWRFPVVGWCGWCSIGTFTIPCCYIEIPMMWRCVWPPAHLCSHTFTSPLHGVSLILRGWDRGCLWSKRAQSGLPGSPCCIDAGDHLRSRNNRQKRWIHSGLRMKGKKKNFTSRDPHLAGGEQHQILDLYFLRRTA